MKKISKKKLAQKNNYVIAVILILLISAFSLVFSSTVPIQAQAADSILRPLIGEKNTLLLESEYFGAQDKLNAMRYSLLGQSAPVYSSVASQKNIQVKNTNQMNLTNIPVPNSLKPLAEEGVWFPIAQNLYPGQEIIARTFIRPDLTHPYAIVSLVKMDMKKLSIGITAGTYYPGGYHHMYGPGTIPQNVLSQNLLLAAFNGGFQVRDGHYGMVVGGKTYVPLRTDMPLLAIYKDGSAGFIDYTGQALPVNVAAVRQNGPYLVKNGVITPYVEQGPDTWGRTTTNSMYTWRSGIGITKNGNLIYAVGNSLIPQSLSEALLKAGAVNAIQLDINPPWVRFIVYEGTGNGKYNFFPLLQSMTGGFNFLRGYNKDFFYIYKK